MTDPHGRSGCAALSWLTPVRVAAFAVALAVAGAGAGVLAAPAVAAPFSSSCAQPDRITDTTPVPWAQTLLGTDRAWAFTKGGSVIVAVLDSGVDATHPQLKGRVLSGIDATVGHGPANTDCAGTGTQVAGIIAAQSRSGVGFHGIAPNARVLPVRIYTDPQDVNQAVPAAVLVRGIDEAVAGGARIIDISMGLSGGSQAVKDAITRAQDQDVLVIAAIGDRGGSGSTSATSYPAAYQDVLGVGAVDDTGTVWTDSRPSNAVDLVGPGVHVAVPELGGGIGVADGTRLAAGFVAGTAALIRARFPKMSATDVASRLEATAIPAPGGTDSSSYGHGIVNPYGAVTEALINTAPGNLTGLVPSPLDSAQAAQQAAWTRSARISWLVTGIAIGLVGITLIAAVAIPLGRRRRWRAALAAAPRERQEDEEPAPPMLLFGDQN